MTSTPRPIRFPDDLWEEVKALAASEDRAPSNMVVRIVRASLSPPLPMSKLMPMDAETLRELTKPGGIIPQRPTCPE